MLENFQPLFDEVQFSSVPRPIGSSGGPDRRFSRYSFAVSSAEGHCEQFRHGQGGPLFDVVHPALPLSNTASSTLQGALKDGSGETVVACDMPKPCKFPSLDSCQKRFLWTHKEVDLAAHPVVDLLLQEGDTEKIPQALGLESLDLLLRVSTQGLCFTAMKEDRSDKILVQFELACEADGVLPIDLV